MWWDKSPVLLPQHPSPDRGDEHVSSVCVSLWVARPQVQRCKTLYIQYIDLVRHGVWLGEDLECLQFTTNPVFPVSLHILLKVKGQTRRVYQIVLVTAVTVACLSFCKSGKDGKQWFKLHQGHWEMSEELQLHYQGLISQCIIIAADAETCVQQWIRITFKSLF